MTRKEPKHLYQDYRDRAKKIAESFPNVSIPDHASVQMVNEGKDGGFVEAVIFVPSDCNGAEMRGWRGVDLDGTLAEWGPGRNQDVYRVGDPIPAMVERVRNWLSAGIEVRIVTARVGTCGSVNDDGVADDQGFADFQRRLIHDWCFEVFGRTLPVTASKDFQMFDLWDDRVVRVEANTGRICTSDRCVGPVGDEPA